MFKKGDRVCKINGEAFFPVKGDYIYEATVRLVENDRAFGEMVWLDETGTWLRPDRIKLVPRKIHPHHDIIIAWLNGEIIEVQNNDGDWNELTSVQHYASSNNSMPAFKTSWNYRIKPKESEKDKEIRKIEHEMRKLADRISELKGYK